MSARREPMSATTTKIAISMTRLLLAPMLAAAICLPACAGNTVILFPGSKVITTDGVGGMLTQEAAPGGSVTYKFTAGSPGTRAYYRGTQGDLQVEMGLYGAIIVLPNNVPTNCTSVGSVPIHYVAPGNTAEQDFRLAAAAYDHARTCYDRRSE